MKIDEKEIKRRKGVALVEIKRSFNDESAEVDAVKLFVSHHLEEIEPGYWLTHLGTAEPEPKDVIDLLELQSHWGHEVVDGIDVFDFTLPGDVTNYVVSVYFDRKGDVEDVVMES